MKQVFNRTKAFLLALLILVTSTGLCQSIVALEEDTPITVTTATEFTNALNSVPDGGTIVISGTCTLAPTFRWTKHNKSITIKGETPESKLDASSVSQFVIRDAATFENLTIAFGGEVYANGNKLVIKESVTVQNEPTLYGGGTSTTGVAKTDITILSGTYKMIYGGSNGGSVSGDVHTYIGGNVNASTNHTYHDSNDGPIYKVFGGSKGGTINGSVYLTFADNAKANYLYGGSSSSGSIKGSIHLDVTGGYLMSIYGGGADSNAGLNSDAGCDIFATITNCNYVEQIFGGSENANHKGNVTLRVLGGTITRRIYGGCYNGIGRQGFSIVWSTDRHVDGDITLVIGSGANITYTSSDDDRAIYATSRYKDKIDTGTCKLVFADSSASKVKTGAQDGTMKYIMSGKAVADSTHTLKHEKTSDTVVTESCSTHSNCLTSTATLALSSNQFEYTGSAITPATLTCTGSWLGDEPTITYSNNVNAGEATVTANYARYSINLTTGFTISKITTATPVLTATTEAVNGEIVGKILGLTTEMEYSTDGENFTPVPDPDMEFALGTYFIRIPETTNQFASETVTITISKFTTATPVLTAVNETIQGKVDGKILGLTTEMEYSTDGETFTPVIDPEMALRPGTYQVRIPETATHFASETVTVTIGTDRHIMDIDLLKVKYQLPLGTSLQSESISPRLIASLNNLQYSKVGFEISKQSEDGEWSAFEALETNVAFISILGTVDGTEVTYTPGEQYGDGASYFFVQNISAISAEDFDTVLRIRAYVVTEDGYTLYGEAANFRLSAVLS